MGYLLPHAALKLKQGFGRLIRSRRRTSAWWCCSTGAW